MESRTRSERIMKSAMFSMAIAVVVLTALPVYGQTTYWIGPNAGNWSVDPYWMTPGEPFGSVPTDGHVYLTSGDTGLYHFITFDGNYDLTTYASGLTHLYMGKPTGTLMLNMTEGPGHNMNVKVADIGDGGAAHVNLYDGEWHSNVMTLGLDGHAGSFNCESELLVRKQLYVGYGGTGTMTVQDGGTMNVGGWAEINYIKVGAMGSTGRLRVMDPGSTVTLLGTLDVGNFDSSPGELEILNGGVVTVHEGDSYSTIEESHWDTATVTIADPGSLLTINAHLSIGDQGTSVVDVTDGGAVSIRNACQVAYSANSAATLTVSDPGSTFGVGNHMFVGGYPNSSYSTGQGEVSVTNGGALTVAEELAIGLAGMGSLDITSNGHVTSATGLVGQGDNPNNIAAVGGVGANWTTGNLTVGEGHGTLTVYDGGTVNCTHGVIGSEAGSVGDVNVTGMDAVWTSTGSIIVGDSGTGTLDIQVGGEVSNVNSCIGHDADGNGAVTIQGAGAVWSNAGRLRVTHGGVGLLTILEGGQATSEDGVVGTDPGSNAEVTITGAGSNWTNSDTLSVGIEGTGEVTVTGAGAFLSSPTTEVGVGTGTGTLNILAGAQATGSTVEIGVESNSDGQVTIDGAGSTWAGLTTLSVGVNGRGQVDVTNGGSLSVPDARLGQLAGADGTVVVSGPQSSFAAASLYCAEEGVGNLAIENGGTAAVGDGSYTYVGYGDASQGTVNVRNAGSTVTVVGDMVLGSNTAGGAVGHLDVSDQGSLTVNGTIEAWGASQVSLDSDGEITAESLVMATGTTLDHEDGTLTINGSTGTFDPGTTVHAVTGPAAPVLRLVNGANAAQLQQLQVGSNGTLELPDGLANGPQISLTEGLLKAAGTVTCKITGAAGSTIAAVGDLTIGIATDPLGYSNSGELQVGANTVTLSSAGPVRPGTLTTIEAGGVLASASGLVLGSGDNLTGAGAVSASLSADSGTSISASGGGLELGDADALDGFFSDGVLQTGPNTVTLSDANQAVLGSLTALGQDTDPGALVAANGVIVEAGKNVTGFGIIDTPDDPAKALLNDGLIVGDSASQQIELTGYVRGTGMLDHVTVVGTDAPGYAGPAAVNRGNIDYAGKILIEIGGLFAGTQHDQVNHSGVVSLGGELAVELTAGFEPSLGDSVTIMTYTGHSGEFDTLTLPALTAGLQWSVDYGVASLTLVVVEPMAGDCDANSKVDLDDYAHFEACLLGPAGGLGAGCACSDIDADGDVTLRDFALLQEMFTGPQ